jgi:proteasome lid subunit RPN8/RPN11
VSDGERVGIAAAVLEAVSAHARDEAPRECCGLLVGTGASIDEAVRTSNLEPGTTRYRIDPADHFRLIKQLRGTGRDIVGAYHSHPRSPARPSPTDIAEASGEGFLYVIASLAAGTPEIRAYRIDGEAAREVTLETR